MTTYHVERERCESGAKLWDAIGGKDMTADEFEINWINIHSYYHHLLTCPNCGKPYVVVETETKGGME